MVQKTMMFRGMTEEEVSLAASRLRAREQKYSKGSIILHAGDTTNHLGLVLDGSVTIENNDIWGNRTILSHVGKGQFFAETYALLDNEPLLVDVLANENCTIIFFDVGTLRNLPSAPETWSVKMIYNLLTISTHKNLVLSGRSFHTAPKTIRGRVLSYLNSVSLQSRSLEFDIPFDRQQLADYLNLERSALSKELGKMQKDGLISFRKNHFILYGENNY